MRSDVVYAVKSTPASPSFGVSPTQSRDRLPAFARDDLNLLLATLVAEEKTNSEPRESCAEPGACDAGQQHASRDARRGEKGLGLQPR